MSKFIGWIVGIVLFCWATISAFSIFSEMKFLVDGWTWSVDQVPISMKAVALAVGKYVSGVVGGYREFIHAAVRMLHLPHLPQIVYDVSGVAAFSIGRGVWLGAKVSSARLESARSLAREHVEALEETPKELQQRLMDGFLRLSKEGRLKSEKPKSPWEHQQETEQIRRDLKELKTSGLEPQVERGLIIGLMKSWDRFPLVKYSRRAAWWLGTPFPETWKANRLFEILGDVIVYGGLVAVVLAVLFGVDFLYRQFT